jgi:DNA-binding CsgD family transcriptional regulator
MTSSESFLVSRGVGTSHAGRHLHWDERDVRFTVEEYKVVQLVVMGYTDREIGRELFMSEWTVRYHLRKVFRRLAIRRRLELVRLFASHSGPGDDLTGQRT